MSRDKRIDYGHYAEKYIFAAFQDWTKADIKAILDALKEAYQLIDKMQESIVKTIGECWVCGNFIDSCDPCTCERQMLEDIELGTASE